MYLFFTCIAKTRNMQKRAPWEHTIIMDIAILTSVDGIQLRLLFYSIFGILKM